MKFKSRRMNAYLYASNLAHIPKQLAWGALKRKQRAQKVKSAYSSQECHVCHHVSRENRPSQQTFCCWCCHHTAHADVNASENTADRLNDQELRNCQNRQEIKVLLQQRHREFWRVQRLAVVQPPAQL
jgi:transposase